MTSCQIKWSLNPITSVPIKAREETTAEGMRDESRGGGAVPIAQGAEDGQHPTWGTLRTSCASLQKDTQP